MADTSLDDFFAKKDKSKKKSKQKATPNESVSQQEVTGRRTKKRQDKEKQSATNMIGPSNNEEDQEWNDYEQETEKDYSGLRIQNLQIKSDDVNEDEGELNPDNDENCEPGEKRENNQGPWSKQSTTTTTPPSPPPPSPPIPPPPPPPQENPESSTSAEEAPKTIGRYIPPSQRGANAGMTPTEARIARIRMAKKEAPNIQSEVDFPSLGGAVNDVESKDFERVRSGNRNLEDTSNHSLPLKLNNKYKALQD